MHGQALYAQVVSKRENLGKSGEIFTIRIADNQPDYTEHLRPDNEHHTASRGADGKQMDIDGYGPDLFFEQWDFLDGPLELEQSV